MKNILLVASTFSEIAPLLQKYKISEHELSGKISFQNSSCSVDIIICGIGIAATTFGLTRALFGKNYSLIINAGICGAYDRNLSLGQTVVITSETWGDLGLETPEGFLTLEEAGLCSSDSFLYQNGKLINPLDLKPYPCLKKLTRVNAITVHSAKGESRAIEAMRRKHQPQVETMEGAAVFYACLAQKVPFLEIRGISNYVEPRNKANWELEAAILNVNHWVELILKDIEKMG